MAFNSEKLNEIFNKHADKIVDMQELMGIALQEYHAQLSNDEVTQVLGEQTDVSRLARIAQATAGLMLENLLISKDGRQFVTLEAYKEMGEAINRAVPSSLPKALIKKAEDAEADAIAKATDYSAYKQALGLKPLF